MTTMQKFDLPSTELCREFFLRIGKEIQVPRGATLPADDVFYILEGHVALTAVTADGECHSFMYFRPGQLFNFFPAVAGACGISLTVRSFSLFTESLFMRTKTACRLVLIERGDFLERMDSQPLQGVLLRALADNLQKALAKSANSCLATAPVRVCRLLAASMAEESPHEIPGYLTHAEIAGHLSLHVMTVTKIFHALREQGILAKQGRAVMVRETGRLLQIANQEKILLY